MANWTSTTNVLQKGHFSLLQPTLLAFRQLPNIQWADPFEMIKKITSSVQDKNPNQRNVSKEQCDQ